MSEKLFNINEDHFLSLSRKKIPLNALYLLEMIKLEKEPDDESYMPMLQWLQRKGYIDNKQKMTQYGEELYNSLFIEGEKIVAKRTKKEKNTLFDKWWEEIYPATNDFEIEGKHFPGSQKKNVKKEECERLFIVLCNSFRGEDIILATKYHIDMAKRISSKKGENQLTYITNSERYLRERYFEPYIEKAKNYKPKSEGTNDTFI